MTWFILALLYILATSAADIVRKILMKDDKNDPLASSIIFQFLGTAIIGLFALYNGFEMPPVQQYPINFLLQGVLWGLATLCLFKAYRYLEASEATIIINTEAIVIIVSAIYFLGEIFTFAHIIGTVLIIISVIFIYSKGSQKLRFNRGVVYALVFSLFAGLAVTNDAYLLKKSPDTLSYLTIGFLTPGIFLLITQPKVLPKLKYFFKWALFKRIFIFTFLYSLAAIAFCFALEIGAQASQLGAIGRSTVIVTILLAVIFLKERDQLVKKIICALLVTIGVLLLR